MNEYKSFGYYFDDIMSQIDYKQWLDFTLKYIKKEDTILDLACGSGTLITLLSLQGFSVDGLDLSSSMIEISKEKAKMNHIYPNLYVMDMTDFNIEKKYDVITCYFDSINHLPSINDVKKMMNCVYKSLNDNGLFIFDIFSLYALMHSKRKIKTKSITCKYIWKTKPTSKTSLRHNLIIKDGGIKIKESYNEYYYDLKDILDERFEIINISGDFTDLYDEQSGRILVVAKKRG